jgi:Uridine kinase
MDKIKHSFIFKTISIVLILTFISLDISYAYPPEHNTNNSTLAIPSVLQQQPINGQLRQSLFFKGALVALICDIGEYSFGDTKKEGIEPLPLKYAEDAMRADLSKHLDDAGIDILNIVSVERLKETVPEKLKAALEEINFEAMPDKGIVFVLCKKGDKKFLLMIARKDRVSSDGLPGYEWAISDEYTVKYVPEDYVGSVVETKEEPKAAISEPIAEIEAPATKPAALEYPEKNLEKAKMRKVTIGLLIFALVVFLANEIVIAEHLLGGMSLLDYYVDAHSRARELVAGITATATGLAAEGIGYYLGRNNKEKLRGWILGVRFILLIPFRYFIVGETSSITDQLIEGFMPLPGGQTAYILRVISTMVSGLAVSAIGSFLFPFISVQTEIKFRIRERRWADANKLIYEYSLFQHLRRVWRSIILRIAPVFIQNDIVQNIFDPKWTGGVFKVFFTTIQERLDLKSSGSAFKILSRYALGFANNTYRSSISNKTGKLDMSEMEKRLLWFTAAFSLVSFSLGSWLVGVIAIGLEAGLIIYHKYIKKSDNGYDEKAAKDEFDAQYEDYLKSLSAWKMPIERERRKALDLITADVMTRYPGENGKKKTFMVAIDGNSGAIKTTTAKDIVKKLTASGMKAVLISRDWFIDSRTERYKRQDEVMERSKYGYSDNEISLIAEKLKSEVFERLRQFNESADDAINIELTGLYDKNSGELKMSKTIPVDRGTIVVIEGNYLLGKRWSKYIDLGVMMLAKPSIGIARRLPRDSHPDKDRIRKVFWRINTPSFLRYLKKGVSLKPSLTVITDSWQRQEVVSEKQASIIKNEHTRISEDRSSDMASFPAKEKIGKATQLFEIVESSLSNERAKYVEAGSKFVEGLDKNMATVEIRQRIEKAIEIASSPAAFGVEAPRNDEKRELQHSRSDGDIEYLKKNLNQFEADGAMGSLIVLARKAKKENQKLIIGLETDWIPGLNVKKSLQHQAITALMKEIDSIAEALESMGLDNVEVIRGSGSQLASAILNEAEKTHTSMHNIVVMASADTINSDSFLFLRGADENERPFLTGIDPTELIKLYTEYGETVSKQLYIRLASLLYMTLELAAGKEPPQSPIIVSYDKKLRILILLPRADPIDCEVLKNNYTAEKDALSAA